MKYNEMKRAFYLKIVALVILVAPIKLLAQKGNDTLSQSQIEERIMGWWKFDTDGIIDVFYEFEENNKYTVVSSGCGTGGYCSIERVESELDKSNWQIIFDRDSSLMIEIKLINDSMMIWGVTIDNKYTEEKLDRIEEIDNY